MAVAVLSSPWQTMLVDDDLLADDDVFIEDDFFMDDDFFIEDDPFDDEAFPDGDPPPLPGIDRLPPALARVCLNRKCSPNSVREPFVATIQSPQSRNLVTKFVAFIL